MNYLPHYYDKVLEMNLLTQVKLLEIEQLWASLNEIRQNQFIETADSQRLRRWEGLLKIRPDLANQSLAYRKSVVLLRLGTTPPLTFRWLEWQLEEQVGAGHFILNLNPERYELRIRLTNDRLGLITELTDYFRQLIPAHLNFVMEGLYTLWRDVVESDYLIWNNVLNNQTEQGLNTWQSIKNYRFKNEEELTGDESNETAKIKSAEL